MHTYRFEWDPTHEGRGGSLEGHVRWELDGKLLGQIHVGGRAKQTKFIPQRDLTV